jgi:hypothetical protein
MRKRVFGTDDWHFAAKILEDGGLKITDFGLPEEAITEALINGSDDVKRNVTNYFSAGAGGWCPDAVRGCVETLVKMAKADADAKEAIEEITKINFTLDICADKVEEGDRIKVSLDGSTLIVAMKSPFAASNALPGMPGSKWEKAITAEL